MRKYAQIYKGEVIYIIDSYASLQDLRKHFSDDTVWMDITDNEDIKVGYIQSIDKDGNIVFIPSLDFEFDNLSEIDKLNTLIVTAKIARDRFLDSIARQYKYIDAKDCYSYEDDYMSKKLKTLRNELDRYINDACPKMNRLSEARELDFKSKAKELKLI